MTKGTAATAAVLPYEPDVYTADFSESFAKYLYEEIHATFAERIKKAFETAELEEHEERPSADAIARIVGLVDKISRTEYLFMPEVKVFFGEASATWRYKKRDVTLLSRGTADDPKLLCYEYRDEQPSHHALTPRATEKDLLNALGCSNKRSGWLYEK